MALATGNLVYDIHREITQSILSLSSNVIQAVISKHEVQMSKLVLLPYGVYKSDSDSGPWFELQYYAPPFDAKNEIKQLSDEQVQLELENSQKDAGNFSKEVLEYEQAMRLRRRRSCNEYLITFTELAGCQMDIITAHLLLATSLYRPVAVTEYESVR